MRVGAVVWERSFDRDCYRKGLAFRGGTTAPTVFLDGCCRSLPAGDPGFREVRIPKRVSGTEFRRSKNLGEARDLVFCLSKLASRDSKLISSPEPGRVFLSELRDLCGKQSFDYRNCDVEGEVGARCCVRPEARCKENCKMYGGLELMENRGGHNE